MLKEAVLGVCLAFLITYIILTEKRINEITSTNTDLRKKVEHLISGNQNLLKGVEGRNQKSEKWIDEITSTNTDLKKKVEHLIIANQKTEKWIDEVTSSNTNLKKKVEHLINANQDLLKGLEDKSKKVGFSASVSSSESSWNSGALVFPSVITNEGNGYNPSTGIFTAPIAGMYVFFVNVQSYRSQTIFVDIVLNGSTKVRTMAWSNGNDYFDAGPNMVVLTIQKGDAVWITRHSGAGYYNDGPITTFSGFLIHM